MNEAIDLLGRALTLCDQSEEAVEVPLGRKLQMLGQMSSIEGMFTVQDHRFQVMDVPGPLGTALDFNRQVAPFQNVGDFFADKSHIILLFGGWRGCKPLGARRRIALGAVCLAVFAELAATTQVLLFTHHRRVFELASALEAEAGVFLQELA